MARALKYVFTRSYMRLQKADKIQRKLLLLHQLSTLGIFIQVVLILHVSQRKDRVQVQLKLIFF